MKTFEIINRKTKEIIYSAEGESLKDVVEQAVREKVSLAYADLRNADLRNADLRNADLRNADLSGSQLEDINLSNADLRNADLRNADLRNADLRNADLRYVNLYSAFLEDANLENAYLSNAYLSNADFRNAVLRDANSNKNYYDSKEIFFKLLKRIDKDNILTDAEHIIISKIFLNDYNWDKIIELPKEPILSLLDKLEDLGYDEYLNHYNNLTKQGELN